MRWWFDECKCWSKQKSQPHGKFPPLGFDKTRNISLLGIRTQTKLLKEIRFTTFEFGIFLSNCLRREITYRLCPTCLTWFPLKLSKTHPPLEEIRVPQFLKFITTLKLGLISTPAQQIKKTTKNKDTKSIFVSQTQTANERLSYRFHKIPLVFVVILMITF